jgi:hypothetical protein
MLIPVVAAAVVVSLAAQTQSANVKTMAGILVKLNHFPSDAEKATLKAIVDNKASPEAERTVAQALINLQHQVGSADKPKLEALVKDKATAEPIRTLSTVILSLNHMPSAADKAKLAKIGS